MQAPAHGLAKALLALTLPSRKSRAAGGRTWEVTGQGSPSPSSPPRSWLDPAPQDPRNGRGCSPLTLPKGPPRGAWPPPEPPKATPLPFPGPEKPLPGPAAKNKPYGQASASPQPHPQRQPCSRGPGAAGAEASLQPPLQGPGSKGRSWTHHHHVGVSSCWNRVQTGAPLPPQVRSCEGRGACPRRVGTPSLCSCGDPMALAPAWDGADAGGPAGRAGPVAPGCSWGWNVCTRCLPKGCPASWGALPAPGVPGPAESTFELLGGGVDPGGLGNPGPSCVWPFWPLDRRPFPKGCSAADYANAQLLN